MEEIASIQKNAMEKIKIVITEYHGHTFVDCRVYFEDDQGEWRPTKKGIALNDDIIDQVIQGLQKASRKLGGALDPKKGAADRLQHNAERGRQ
jgi:hypothetical protein